MMGTILFVCVHNSVRSQMAEGLAHHYGRDLVEAYSAGFYETGVNPLVIKVMEEIGIDVSGQSSKTLNELEDVSFDYVISLYIEMEKACPVFPGANQIHWPTPDPGKVEGTPEEVLAAFRWVRDDLKRKIIDLLARIKTD